jgi:hypothetical protein
MRTARLGIITVAVYRPTVEGSGQVATEPHMIVAGQIQVEPSKATRPSPAVLGSFGDEADS